MAAEPPRRPSLDFNYPSTPKNNQSSAAVGIPQNNYTHSRAASMGYNTTQGRANAYSFSSHIPHPDLAGRRMDHLPQQHAAGAPEDTQLPWRPEYAPHAHVPEAIPVNMQTLRPQAIPQGYGSGRPGGDGVHPRPDTEWPTQPPSPTSIRIRTGGYTDRFGKTHLLSGSFPSPSVQQQPEQQPQAVVDVSHRNALTSPPVQTPHKNAIDDRPARTVEEDTRPARRTNVLCRDFRKGLCRNNDCPRAHVLDLSPDLLAMLPQGKQRTPNVQVPAVVPESMRNSNVEFCKLNLVGKCPRGSSCKYSHDLGQGVTPSFNPEPVAVAGPSKVQEPFGGGALVPTRILQAPPQKPSTDVERSGAAQPIAASKNPNFIVYPDDVCRNYILGRCQHVRCKYKHWSPDVVRAFREANRMAQDVVASADSVPLAAALPLPEEARTEPTPAHPVVAVPNGLDTGGVDKPSHGNERPPDITRKRSRKRGEGKKSSSDRDDQAQSPQGERMEAGRREKSREEKNVIKGKENVVAGPIQGKEDHQGKPTEKTDKGKRRVKKGVNEQENGTVAQQSHRKGKGKAEEGSASSEVKAPTEHCRKPTDLKGKGVARPSPPCGEVADKNCASQNAPLKAASGRNSKRNSAKKTGAVQTSTPAPQTPTAQTGPLKGPAAANDTETESVSSDDSFYSTRDSAVVSAQTSLSSVDNSTYPTVLPEGVCWDYVHGRCYRSYCRFSHDVDLALFSKVSRPSAARALPEREARPRSNTLHRTLQTGSDASKGTTDPLVPPGLGLESFSTGGRDDALPRQQLESVTITVHDSTKVTFSSGFGVIQVITSFESRQIILENVPPSVAPADITTTLQKMFGEIVAVLPGDAQDPKLVWRVTFAQADAAAEAAAALNGSCLFGVRVTARVATKKSTGIGGGTLSDGDVLFELPTPRLTAYIGYETKEQAERAIALANRKEIKGMWVTANLYEGIPMVGPYNICVEGLHPDTSVKDLGRFGKFEGYMWERPKYSSMSGAIQGLRHKLLQHDDQVTINVLPPPYRKMFRVWAHFDDEKVAQVACGNLHRFCPLFTGKQRIFAHHIKSLRYNLPPAIFDVLAYDINLLRDYCMDDKGTSISVIDRRQGISPSAPVLVKLVSHDMSALSRLKAAFDQLLRGEKVTENGQVVWNDFFGSPAGQEFLAELQRVHPKVMVNRDPRRRTLALFGREPHRSRVRDEILARARLLRAQRQRRYPVAGDLIGVFMSEDLFKLQSELGHENVWFDLTNKELVVRGDEDAQKVAGLAVRHAVQRRQRRPASADAVCPVCLDEVTQPVTLSCGHRWCHACLTGYMHASVDNKTFPLKCLGDDAKCTHCIPLSLAQQLLTPDEFDAIVRASFMTYIQSRPDEFHYCPTPDCPQVYRKTKRNTVLQCPSCLVRICPHCNTEWHERGSCQDRDPQDELLFEKWKGRHDVKDCPSCKVPIERMAGCNHMTCVSCKTHICWACLATFPTSQEVYDHMRAIHGGIGL